VFVNSQHIYFTYTAEKKVLEDITFALAKGETLAIVGASGCGKSTLLRILSGILPNTKSNSLQGEILIDGLTPDQYRQTGKLAFMFQEATLMPHLTVRQNIELPLRIKGRINEQKIKNLIKAVGLEEYSNYLPKQLSGGMKTRVALARAFVNEPELLLLDEPFSALDIAWKSKLYLELAKLKGKIKSTVVIVTHDVQEALLLADRVIVLSKKGKSIKEEPTKSLIINRINHIASYTNTPEFLHQYSSIQKWIIDDGIREITTSKEIDRILNHIQSVAGDEDLEFFETMDNDVISIRNYSNNKTVNELLYDAFLKGKTFHFKYELVWDILEYSGIEEKKITTIQDFYIQNIDEASKNALAYHGVEKGQVFEHLVSTRILNIEKYTQTKRWIYICDMYASSETNKVLQYLDDVIKGEVEALNYPLAKEVAEQVKSKIKNEKQDTLHTV